MPDRVARTLVDLGPDDERWEQALPVLRELRSTRTTEQLRTSIREGAPQGLRFTAVFDGGRCTALAGWRILVNTSAGRKLHVDDLVTTASARSSGLGALLLDELARRGAAAGCTSIELDSGVQRFDAHRFSLRERLHIGAHHFQSDLSRWSASG